MKLSELIKALQLAEQQNGDAEVLFVEESNYRQLLDISINPFDETEPNYVILKFNS